MKKQKYIFILFLLLVSVALRAKEPVSAVKNSVITTIPLVKVTNESALNATNSLTTIQYLDGFGRSNITVAKGITPLGQDLVSMVSYDYAGRTADEWLPAPVTLGNNLPDPASIGQSAKTFYNDTLPYSTMITETGAFSQSTYTPPGKDWHNNTKEKKLFHRTNWAADPSENFPLHQVNKYVVMNTGVKKTGIYPAGTLKVSTIIDEDNKEIDRFYDCVTGNLILERKVYNEANNVFYDTYYVYDDLGNRCFVLSPEASNRMTVTNTTYTSAGINTANNPMDQYAYIYRYDGQSRCIALKKPGADWIYYVYDMASRLILEQSGNQRATNEWSFCKYDGLGRTIQTGTTTITASHTSLQNTYSTITVTESWQSNGYTNSYTLGTNRVILMQNFYDNYNFLSLRPTSTQSHLTYTSVSGFDAKYSRVVEGVDIATQGLLTGTSVSLLNQSGVIYTAMYYDEKNRIVQSLSNNQLDGYDKYYFSYNFPGLSTKYRHKHKAYNKAEVTENYIYNYDASGRKTSVYYTLNNQTPIKLDSLQYDEVTRVKKKILHNGTYGMDYTYNIHNKIQSVTSPLFTQSIRYQNGNTQKYYNGNVSEIDETNNGQTNTYSYNYDAVDRLSSAKYDLTGNNHAFTSDYIYDRNGNTTVINRNGFLRSLNMNGNTTPTIGVGYVDHLQISLSGNHLSSVYDYMDGNVGHATVANTDFKDRNNGGVEFLYDSNGNMTGDYNKNISWIKYNVLNLPHKIQMGNGDKTEYLYDAGGKKRKATYSIALNNMQIPLGNTGTENTTNISTTSTRDYCGNFIYKNGILERILTTEGYIAIPVIYITVGSTATTIINPKSISSVTTQQASEAAISLWKPVYYVKDRLGSVRGELTGSASNSYTWKSSTNYYPFGVEAVSGTNASASPEQFGGNELERINTMHHDFHHRWIDQQLDRFTTMDPLAELNYSISPYAYCDNNPINYIDPWGLDKGDEDDPYDSDGYTGPDIVITPPRGGGGGYGGGYPGGYDYNPFVSNTNFISEWEMLQQEKERANARKPNMTNIEAYDESKLLLDIAEYVSGLGNTISTTIGNLKQNELFWRDANGNFRSADLLKKGANGKYVRGVQGLRNSNAIAGKAAQSAKVLGSTFAFVGIGINAYDMGVNGINVSNSMDMIMIGVGFIPGVGWAISGAYFIADTATMLSTGQSISQHTQNWTDSW